MSKERVIEAAGLGKAFIRAPNPLHMLYHVLSNSSGNQKFWALQDINLSLDKGESLGIVGRNGSGKSTLLQLICGTLRSTTGSIATRGKIVAMLELGAGFNPEFSGCDNVYLCASAYGLDEATIRARIGKIEAFAEIGEYFNRPVRVYSSGMYARLAFAVCAHVDADILIVDEILGVGDAGFQKKCQKFMQEFQNYGTLLFVSHDPGAVLSVCKRAIWLEDGKKIADGSADSVLKAYTDAMYTQEKPRSDNPADDSKIQFPFGATKILPPDCEWQDSNKMAVGLFNPESPRHGFGGCRIEDCFFSKDGKTAVREICGGEVVTLHLVSRAERNLSRPIAGFMFRNDNGQNLFGDNTYITYKDASLLVTSDQVFESLFKFQMPYLPDGKYSLAPSIIEGTQQNHIHLDWREDAVHLSVKRSPVKYGQIGVAMQSIGYDL